jgi:hypothetical protein
MDDEDYLVVTSEQLAVICGACVVGGLIIGLIFCVFAVALTRSM